MTTKDNGGPAFPFEFHNQTSMPQPSFYAGGVVNPDGAEQFSGMSLRDWFATHAPPVPEWWMSEELNSIRRRENEKGMDWSQWRVIHDTFQLSRITSWNVAYADAMLAETSK